MRTNTKAAGSILKTAEGAPAALIDDEQALRRTVLSCLLWEDHFYEGGEAVGDRIRGLVARVSPQAVASLAIEARERQHLRHVPLLLVSALSRHAGGKLVEDAVARVVQRADELSELVALHARLNGVSPNAVKKTLPAAMKRGLARAFLKFDGYALAKYNRDTAVKLRDVLFLVHAKPDGPEREALWKQLIAGELRPPDTWEVALSGGADKRETFERLIREGGLGYLALLRNLRNMVEAGCDLDLVRDAILARKGASRVLPFRYVAAARACPQLEPAIDEALLAALRQMPKLAGKTLLLVDVSGSMGGRLSARADMTRLDAAGALAAIVIGQCETPVVYATAGSDAARVHRTERLPPRAGMAMVDAVKTGLRTLGGGGIFLTQALSHLRAAEASADRIVVITDEQDCDTDPQKSPAKADAFGTRNYLLNISGERNGIGYGPKWTHIDGFSENVIRYIVEAETVDRMDEIVETQKPWTATRPPPIAPGPAVRSWRRLFSTLFGRAPTRG